MKCRLDKILHEFMESDFGFVRLGRKSTQAAQRLLLAKALAKLEARGHAVRTLDTKGNICWKATPALRDQIADRKTDAEDELEREEV